MIHNYQKNGGKASKKIKDIAKSIDPESAEDFAKTSHKDLPNRKAKKHKQFDEWLKERDPKLYESATTTSDVAVFMNRLDMPMVRRGYSNEDPFFRKKRK